VKREGGEGAYTVLIYQLHPLKDPSNQLNEVKQTQNPGDCDDLLYLQAFTLRARARETRQDAGDRLLGTGPMLVDTDDSTVLCFYMRLRQGAYFRDAYRCLREGGHDVDDN
jgi:hypothetical protein